MSFVKVICILILFCAMAASAQDDAALRRMQEGKKNVNDYMQRAARALTDRAGEEIKSKESWALHRSRRLEELRDMLGLLPWPERTPLNLRITGTIDQGAYSIEKIHFESLPKFYVTANLYVPKSRSKPLPAVIYVCAHDGGKAKYQHYAQSLAKNGYVALVVDPIQHAEAFGFHHGVVFEEMHEWYSRGYTPAGIEVWNAIRALDYLETRPEVDKSRIGMTGFSGGAMMSYFTAAVDDRIKAAAPFMGISTFAANMREDAQNRHCDCMFAVNLHRQDLIHIGALIAPRPLLSAQGKLDTLFPVPGYREFAEKVGALYRALGKPDSDAYQLLEIDAGHADTEYMREQTIRWFDRHLLRIPERKLDLGIELLPKGNLLAFPNGAPRDAQNFRVHEILTPAAPLRRFSSLAAWESRRAKLLETLRSRILSKVPEKPRGLRLEKVEGANEVRQFHEYVLSSEDTVPIRFLFRRAAGTGDRQPALMYIASAGEDALALERVFRGVRAPAQWAWAIVFPRGVGEIPWNRISWRATLRNAMAIGETADSMRLSDVVVAVEALRAQEGVDPDRIGILGRGLSGAIGMYAAVLDERIRQVTLIDPPITHADGPIFLNILRHTDLPEVAALIAPRSLRFYLRLPSAYEHTRHIYSLYGKSDQFSKVVRVGMELSSR